MYTRNWRESTEQNVLVPTLSRLKLCSMDFDGSLPRPFVGEELDDIEPTPELLETFSDTDIEIYGYNVNANDDDGSSSSSCESHSDESESTCNEHKAESAMPMVNSPKHLIVPSTSVATPISTLSKIPASSWNLQRADQVYKAFKVNSYIITPDCFLSLSPAKPLKEAKNARINNILESLCRPGSGTESCIDTFEFMDECLEIFDGVEALAMPSRIPAESIEDLLQKFHDNITRKIEQLSSDKRFVHVCGHFEVLADQFLRSYGMGFQSDWLQESVSQLYIRQIISMFARMTNFPLWLVEKDILELDLISPHNMGQAMQLSPDVLFMFRKHYFMVGEVKRFGKVTYSKKENEVLQTQVGPKQGPDVIQGTEEKAKQGLDVTQDSEEKTKQGADVKHGSEENTKQEAGVEHGSEEGAGGEPCVTKKVNKNSRKLAGIEEHKLRSLTQDEHHQLRGVLPELIAQMLASMQSTGYKDMKLQIIQTNERHQIAITVQGFKLRLVRLILRKKTNRGLDLPTVADIRNPAISCDIVVTKEFNLFKRHHLNMLFKILFAVTHKYSRS